MLLLEQDKGYCNDTTKVKDRAVTTRQMLVQTHGSYLKQDSYCRAGERLLERHCKGWDNGGQILLYW